MSPTWHGDYSRRTLTFAALAIYLLTILAVVLGDPVEQWLIVFPDSYDWMANGLRLTGLPIDCTWRAPALPLVHAGLYTIGLENLIPWIGPTALLGLLAGLCTVGYTSFGRAALVAAVWVGTNHMVLTHALVIGADMACIAIGTLGILQLGRLIERPSLRGIILGGAAIGVAARLQPGSPMWLPSLAVPLFLGGHAPWRRQLRRLGAVAIVALFTMVTLEMLRGLSGGTWLPASRIGRPVAFPTSHLGYYLWSTVGSWSIPVAVLAGVGASLVSSGTMRAQRALMLVTMATVPFVFFSTIYDWRDDRFVLYWTVPGLLLAGMGLGQLPRPFRAPLVVLGIIAGNLATDPLPSPVDAEVVWRPGRAAVLDYHSGAIRDGGKPYPFRDSLRRWVRSERRRRASPSLDTTWWSNDRHRTTRAAADASADSIIGLVLPPGTHPTAAYVIRNQAIITARRAVVDVTLPAPRTAPRTLLLPAALLDAWRARLPSPDDGVILYRSETWVAVRLRARPRPERRRSSAPS